jgi:hypothetical protein
LWVTLKEVPEQQLAMKAFKPVPEVLLPMQPVAVLVASRPVPLVLVPTQFSAAMVAKPVLLVLLPMQFDAVVALMPNPVLLWPEQFSTASAMMPAELPELSPRLSEVWLALIACNPQSNAVQFLTVDA